MKGKMATLWAHFEGTGAREGGIALSHLADFGRDLQNAVFRVAMIIQGHTTSARSGPPAKYIVDSCTLELVGTRAGSTVLHMRLREPEGSEVPSLFDRENLGEQALEKLFGGIELLESQCAVLPPGYDKGVLSSWRDTGRILDRGVETIQFQLRTRTVTTAVVFNAAVRDHISARIQQPVHNRRTAEGRLLMGDFKETGYRCRVHPPVGPPVPCTFDEALCDTVQNALRRPVRVVGEATEKDGKITNLDIVDIEILQEEASSAIDDALGFEETIDIHQVAARQGVGPLTDIDALSGDFWPEDESADDFVAAVRQWRRDQEQDRPKL